MIDLTTGVPGSGKTYRIVAKIYDLITSKEKKYKHIFTNINGLDYDKCNKLAGEIDYVLPFEFPDLKKEIDLEFSYHQKSKNIVSSSSIPLKFDYKTDEELSYFSEFQLKDYEDRKREYELQRDVLNKELEEQKQLKENYDDYLKSLGVFELYSHSLIVIDECHLYFEDRADEKLIRFLSYHRHFDLDLDLITQNKNLINKKYLSFIETMYVAYPASKRFFSKVFRYKKYASYQEYHANIIGTESLKLSQNIFELYSSGSNKLGKTVISKFFLPPLIIALAAFLFFDYFVSSKEEKLSSLDDANTSNISNSVVKPDKKVRVVKSEFSNISEKHTFFIVDCFKNSCNFKGYDTSFSQDSMFKIVDYFSCKMITNNVADVNFNTYFFDCSISLADMLSKTNKSKMGGMKNENTNKSLISNVISSR